MLFRSVLEVVDKAEGLPVCQQLGDGVALVVAELEGEEAVGFEGGVGLGDEAAVDVESGCAGEEGDGGFVVADLGVEGRAVGGGDIGRVGDDGVPPQRAKTARRGPRSVKGKCGGLSTPHRDAMLRSR